MSVRLSCPSCNTGFALDAIPGNRRATCPRCGDVFPVRGEVAEEPGGGRREAGDKSQPTATLPTTQPKSGLSMRRAVLLALTLGLLGLAAGLIVYFTRDKPRPQPEPEPVVASPDATPPAQLAGLGYLPAECNVVFAVQPGPLIVYAERTKQDPRELLAKTGMPKQVLDVIDGLGIPLQQIDHLAAGAFFGDKIDEEMRFAFVFTLKQPVANEEEFLKKLGAEPSAKKKAYWKIHSEKVPLQLLARVSPTVWMFGLSEGDFAAVDRGGFGPGGTQFRGSDSEGVRKMIASVPPDAAVWMLADDDRDWTQKPVMAFLLKGAKNSFPVVKEGRGGLLAIRFGEQPRMRLFVRAVDEETADRVRTYFKSRAAEMESATSGGGGAFAMFDAPFDPAATGPMLQRFLADARK